MDIIMVGLIIGLGMALALFRRLDTRPFYPERGETSEELPWKEWER